MENNHDDKYQSLVRVIRQLLGLITGLLLLVLLLFALLFYIQPEGPLFPFLSTEKTPVPENSQVTTPAPTPAENFWKAPDAGSLASHPDKEKIEYGKSLVAETALYFGPEGTIRKNATNGMNCQNCHLDAGTKVYGNNYGSVFSTYPKYRGRSGGIENIHKRINDCFERSLNGQPLDTNSKEMDAMVAYIHWLGKDVPKGELAKGSGLKELAFPDRAADPEKGRIAYEAKCQSCHMANGEGQMNPQQTAYLFPPLWGKNSYNNGAGLYRVTTFARYIKYNMPQGASYENPMLSDEEAWDIAAFVNSQSRPEKDIRKDWPKIEDKPIDHPFGPFADSFTEEQHKYGPFKPIQEARAKSGK